MAQKNKIIASFIALMALFTLNRCNTSEPMDLILHNAKIYSVNDAFNIHEAMAIKDGKIVDIGPENDILNKYISEKIIDCKKRTIYPGFIDAHCHFVGYALNLKEVNLIGTTSYEDVLSRVKKFADANPNGWIVGRGWDQNDWEEKDFPTRFALDELFPNRPVFLTRVDGHAALANKTALKIAGINSNSKVDGGAIMGTFINDGDPSWFADASMQEEVDHHSYPYWEPTGILLDNAVDIVKKHIPPPTSGELRKALLSAQQNLLAVGITTVDDAGLTKDTIDLIQDMHKQNKLFIKVYAMVSCTEEMLSHYLASGPIKTDKLSVCSFKFYADGALGSRGASLIEPYTDITGNHHGFLLHDRAFFEKYAPLLHEKGFQMNTHCIGDSANRMILEIYGKVLKDVNDKRWRIEHAQVIHENDFELFRKYTIIPSVQPTHATSDMYWAEERLGKDRVKNAYAFKRLLELNGLLALGTDFPVENINPLNTFYAAVFRKDVKGYPADGYQMENALSRIDALKGMTIWAAIANFEENEKGSLEIGKCADFVIFDKDIMEVEESELLNCKVMATYIDGQKRYGQ